MRAPAVGHERVCETKWGKAEREREREREASVAIFFGKK